MEEIDTNSSRVSSNKTIYSVNNDNTVNNSCDVTINKIQLDFNIIQYNRLRKTGGFSGFCFFSLIIILKFLFILSVVSFNPLLKINTEKYNKLHNIKHDNNNNDISKNDTEEHSEVSYIYRNLISTEFIIFIFFINIITTILLIVLKYSSKFNSEYFKNYNTAYNTRLKNIISNNTNINTNHTNHTNINLILTIKKLFKIDLDEKTILEIIKEVNQNTCNKCFPFEKAYIKSTLSLYSSFSNTRDNNVFTFLSILERIFRTHHCTECNICIKSFDHHCGLLNKCIGEFNILLFFLYLIIETLCLISNFNIVLSLVNYYTNRNNSIEVPFILYFLSFFIGIFFIITLYLSLFYMCLILTNQTNYEKASCLGKIGQFENSRTSDSSNDNESNESNDRTALSFVCIFKRFKRNLFGSLPGNYVYLVFDDGVKNNFKYFFDSLILSFRNKEKIELILDEYKEYIFNENSVICSRDNENNNNGVDSIYKKVDSSSSRDVYDENNNKIENIYSTNKELSNNNEEIDLSINYDFFSHIFKNNSCCLFYLFNKNLIIKEQFSIIENKYYKF